MVLIGQIVVYIIVICAAIGAVFAVIKPEHELGKQFIEGIHSIGPIFLSVAGIFAAIPYINLFIKQIAAPFFYFMGADPSMAATTVVAVDMGGYQLAQLLASTKEDWIMAMMNGYMAGATMVFSIPVGLRLIDRKDHSYFALGILSGILTIPIGVFISGFIILLTKPMIRDTIATSGDSTYQMVLNAGVLFGNLTPLIIICGLLALGLLLLPRIMIRYFLIFGRLLDAFLKLFLAFFIVEHFTGLVSQLFGNWVFDPVIADIADPNRALEIAGYTGLMLAGAFPMVHLIKTYLQKPLTKLGMVFHLDADTVTGCITAATNVLALFPIVKDMQPMDKVRTIAFAVCGAFLIGDHLSFTANFQPTLILPLFCGKLLAGGMAVWIAELIVKLKFKQLEKL